LKPVQREILTRFYLKGEQPAEICKAMNLTDTQYRLLKSRSRQILQEVVAKRMTRKPLVAQAAAGR
jgi:DNA-directed RNA polymerase specialized sigma24 family protein